MPSALIKNMCAQYGYPMIGQNTLDKFLATHHEAVLFFTGDPARIPESNDVAMVLPELDKAFNGRLIPAVIKQDSERELQARYRFTSWPTLVFLRDGQYLGAISKIQDWADYLRLVAAILEKQSSAPPPFNINQACSASGHTEA